MSPTLAVGDIILSEIKVIERLSFTQDTEDLVSELTEIHGDLVFHQSGGCCDGSAPMCFPRDEFTKFSVSWVKDNLSITLFSN